MFSDQQWLANSGSGFFNDIATQSLRFDGSAYLSFNPSSASSAIDRRKVTHSFWVKRCKVGASQYMYTAKVAGSDFHIFGFNADDTIQVTINASNSNFSYKTTAKFRDTSAWYHFVLIIDTTQSTDTNRVKLYVNGDNVTLPKEYSNYVSLNYSTLVMNDVDDRVGQFSWNNGASLDAYMAESILTIGQDNTIDQFGEVKNGVWISKEYEGSYGGNGFRFQFNKTGVGTASTSTIGADTSGNTNHWTSNGIVVSDCSMIDSPENNFCNLNVLDKGADVVLADGNLGVSWSANNGHAVRGNFVVSKGKWYAEFMRGVSFLTVGIAKQNNKGVGDGSGWIGSSVYGAGGSYSYVYSGVKYTNGSATNYGASFASGDIIGVAFDADNGTITFYKNGASQGQAYTSISGEFAFGMGYFGSTINGTKAFANFGQDPSFAGTLTGNAVGDQTPSEGAGVFKYAVPTNFKALCTANLPEPTIGENSLTQADDHFNTILWTGNGGDDRSISGVGFKPDWVWLKQRNGTNYHTVFDSIRGATKAVYPNDTEAEATNADTLQAFESDGFELGTSGGVNGNNNTFVAWNWKAGGASPEKTYRVVVVSDNGNKYRFRNSANSATFGASAVTLDLQEGGTYTFDQSDSTNNGHPFRFSTTSNGTHGGGSAYTTGVTVVGTAGQAGAYVKIVVASSAPQLYYYCTNHSNMGGQANTNITNGSTNFNGSILSVETANTDAGFSIVTYTGTGSALTVGHGLGGVAPSMIIAKARGTPNGSARSWFVFHKDLGASAFLYLDLTNGQVTSNNTVWGGVSPSTTVFSLGNEPSVNFSSQNYVAYCFAEIEGYSKYGKYISNGSTDGSFVYTGFDISFLMIKRASATSAYSSWAMYDNVRKTINSDVGTDSNPLFANNNSREGIRGNGSASISGTRTAIDFLSNGFKIRDIGDEIGVSGNTYIYMAFAKNTFKYSTAQ